ncbi:MAG: beta-lactamase family protein, partial [Deltaproteobacteria bacterium]|nr:beta-lactamase family protein [Deltaproteobacteria bacterium]
GETWKEDTVSVVFSCTKGAAALCAHILASEGLLDFDAPVVEYWPEFGKAGKEAITVKMLLNHQSGIAAIREPLPKGAFYDWDLMVHLLEEQEPFWEPGTRHGYHAYTFGWLVGEVVRRISRKSLGNFFQEKVAQPLGLDFWIGLPPEIEPRVAKMISPEAQPNTLFFKTAQENKNSLQRLFLLNDGGFFSALEFDSRAAHAAEIPAANGITNARGLAGMYAPLSCGGGLKGIDLVDSNNLARMSAVSSASDKDAMLLISTRLSLGFWKSMDNRGQHSEMLDSLIISEDAFGHPGAGGSIGFADPMERMSFGYSMNKMGPCLSVNPRGQNLIDAVYMTLGYTSDVSGRWVR